MMMFLSHTGVETASIGTFDTWSSVWGGTWGMVLQKMDLLTLKNDITWNRNFYNNLQKEVNDFKSSVGKWDVYAEWHSSNDYKHDAVSVVISGTKLRYPAKYTIDNNFAIDNDFRDKIYTNSGIQLLSTSGHNVYYRAFLKGMFMKGVIQNIERWTSVMMDGLHPLLYYKNRYLFTLKNNNTQQSLFVINDQNELETLGWWKIDNVSIDSNIVAFQDTDSGIIYFLWLDNLKIIKTITIGTTGLSFQWFVVKNTEVWTAIQDNINKKMIYQKRKREIK